MITANINNSLDAAPISNQHSNHNRIQVQIKTLHGKTEVWDDVDGSTMTIEDLYRRVQTIETTEADGKWKLMMVKPIIKTLKWNEKERMLQARETSSSSMPSPSSTGGSAILPHGVSMCRIEVVLDMGTCHSTCRRP